MPAEALVRALHIITIMAFFGMLLAIHLQTARSLDRATLRRLASCDRIAWLLALLVVASGATLWFGVGKPASFYTGNGLFHGKLTLVVLTLAVGLRASLFWRAQRHGDEAGMVAVPASVKALQGVQLLLLLLIPVLATLIARGVGAGD